MKKQTKSVIIWGSVIALIIFGLIATNSKNAKASPLAGMNAIVYRTASCGCCRNYISYLRSFGINVDERIVASNSEPMNNLKVPLSLASCHTTEIGGYTVEGHIPVEAIEKLISEKSSVAGIGMAGMPSGSPGMPGSKEPFYIKSFQQDGSTADYLTL